MAACAHATLARVPMTGLTQRAGRPENLRGAAVIFSPDLGVFAVAAAGVLCGFAASRTHYLDSVSAAYPAQVPLSLLFLELNGYYANAVQLHVHAADIQVRRGVDREDSR